MTSKVLIIASVLFLCLGLSVFAEANLLTNPGFETGDFTGWIHGGYAFVLNENPRAGDYHARADGDGGFLQGGDIAPGESYKLSVWAYISDGDGEGTVYLSFRNSDGQYFDAWEQALEELPRNEYNFVDSGWLTAPDDAVYVEVHAGVTADFYADLDDFNFSPIPEPSSLLLLGTGLLSIFGFGLRRKR